MIHIPPNSDFSIHNLPFGIFSTQGSAPKVGIAVGARVLDLTALSRCHKFDFDSSVFQKPFLNDFISLGKHCHRGRQSRRH